MGQVNSFFGCFCQLSSSCINFYVRVTADFII
uniref:Uncharacterized protein n=1 Tax=Rhizophora mucronata TaxID=61149 RepID=A0A2P2NP84_RHIMU